MDLQRIDPWSARKKLILEDAGYPVTIVPTEDSELGYWYANKETLKADISIKYAGHLVGPGGTGSTICSCFPV